MHSIHVGSPWYLFQSHPWHRTPQINFGWSGSQKCSENATGALPSPVHYSWFAMTSTKILINDILTKFFQNANNPILNGSCKFQIQELQLFKVKKMLIPLHCGSHVGRQKNAHQPIFPNNIIENSPTSLAPNFVFIRPNNFKFWYKDMFYGLIGHIKIWGKLIVLCIGDVKCKPAIAIGDQIQL